jgi:hypothetical protein
MATSIEKLRAHLDQLGGDWRIEELPEYNACVCYKDECRVYRSVEIYRITEWFQEAERGELNFDFVNYHLQRDDENAHQIDDALQVVFADFKKLPVAGFSWWTEKVRPETVEICLHFDNVIDLDPNDKDREVRVVYSFKTILEIAHLKQGNSEFNTVDHHMSEFCKRHHYAEEQLTELARKLEFVFKKIAEQKAYLKRMGVG